MKIFIGHNSYQHPGGEDAVFRSEAQMLRARGHEVLLYERSNQEVQGDLPSQIAQLFSLRSSRSSYNEVRRLLRSFRPDIAHFHNTFFRMTPAVYEACHAEGVPVVQSLHNFRWVCLNGLLLRDGKVCELCSPVSRGAGIFHRCYRHSLLLSMLQADMTAYHWRQRTWLKHVDCYIVATEFTRGQFIRYGLPAGKIAVKPHFAPDAVGSVVRHDGGYVLYAGRLSVEKGVERLLDAWEAMEDIPLLIVGSGPLEARMRERIDRSGMAHVQMLGYLSAEQFQDVLQGARVAVVPSLCYENFPRVVVEAYAAGVAVAVSRLGSLAEVVVEGVTGSMFDPLDPADMRAVLRKMSTGRQWQLMGEQARREYGMRYTEALNYQALMDIYARTVKATTGSPDSAGGGVL